MTLIKALAFRSVHNLCWSVLVSNAQRTWGSLYIGLSVLITKRLSQSRWPISRPVLRYSTDQLCLYGFGIPISILNYIGY